MRADSPQLYNCCWLLLPPQKDKKAFAVLAVAVLTRGGICRTYEWVSAMGHHGELTWKQAVAFCLGPEARVDGTAASVALLHQVAQADSKADLLGMLESLISGTDLRKLKPMQEVLGCVRAAWEAVGALLQ